MTKAKLEANQTYIFKDGNEMAALAATHINFHVMGYYPITPSTAVPEDIDAMHADGENDISMVPADGEHGAAGICFGASTAGGRVVNATSSQGLLYSMEELPVQSGTRLPMVLNIATRTISGPLSIKCDHSDVMFALNAAWIVMMAKDPQRVYDFNMIACKIGEKAGVRLPVIVAYDGFITSHQKRKSKCFKDRVDIEKFIGKFESEHSSIDPRNPVSIGPYMNEPDLINNKMQLNFAMQEAYKEFPGVFEEYSKISGRQYSMVEAYRMEEAETAIFILNTAFDTACEAVDIMRNQGKKVGAVALTVIRPFPITELQQVFKNIKVACIAERQDSPGGWGGNMSFELKAALKDDKDNKTTAYTRIFGLGGKEFYTDDAIGLLEETIKVKNGATDTKMYDYIGIEPGEKNYRVPETVKPLSREKQTVDSIKVEMKDMQLTVKGVVPRKLTKMPKRIVSGHGACPGCGIFTNLNIFLKGIQGDVVLLFQTGCAMVVTTGYPYTSHRVSYVHNLFQNGAETMSGIVEMYHERMRRKEISEDLTFIMVTGDGGNDIGMASTLGTAIRNHKMIILEYDNEGYMNTGNQLSFSTPLGAASSTSNVGPKQVGKRFHHKDTAQIMAATHIPYVFTASEANEIDFIKKAAKAQYIAKNEGLVFGKVLSVCPLNWKSDPALGKEIIEAAVNSCFFPLYEVNHGKTVLTYNPEEKNKKVPLSEWVKYIGRMKHLLKPENKELYGLFEEEVTRRWSRIKAMSEHPLL